MGVGYGGGGDASAAAVLSSDQVSKYFSSCLSLVLYFSKCANERSECAYCFTRETQNECAVGSCELLSFDISR